jgi:hypothetical protein
MYRECRLASLRDEDHAIIITETKMIKRSGPRVVTPTRPREASRLAEKSMTKELQGAGLKRCEGIQRATEMMTTKKT